MLHLLLLHWQAEQLPQSVHVLSLVIAIARGIMFSGCMFVCPILVMGMSQALFEAKVKFPVMK